MGSKPCRGAAPVWATFALALAATAVARPGAAEGASAFALGVGEAGVYRVTWEALAAAAPPDAPLGSPVAAKGLALSNRGEAVPIHLQDGGDGRFGPGDAFVFEGRQLAGETTHYAEFARWNVYQLRLAGEPGARLAAPPDSRRTTLHREQQEIRVRFAKLGDAPTPEVWYWAKLTAIDPDPYRLTIELPVREAAGALELRIGVRGWSRDGRSSPDAPADHRIEATWNGVAAGKLDWNDQEGAVLEATVPASSIRARNELVLRVPRRSDDAGQPLIDVALLDWIELESASAFVAQAPLEPAWVKFDRPSAWRAPERHADYLMIVHSSLAEAIEPLARFHRARGLGVEVVLVDDLFDEFANGIEDPRAIRDFIAYARQEWSDPAPRFVLLVGDASWDPFHATGDDSRYADWTYRAGEQQTFVKNASTAYAELDIWRGLVPTFEIVTREGEAASDNAFVAVEGADTLPDLAIGRFPVTTPEEVSAIVAKTIRYATNADNGDWQSRALWITDQEPAFQAVSDRVAGQFEPRGLAARKIYPKKEEPDNLARKTEIFEAFSEGQLLVHFFGHGGRYIWRTGPPDLVKNHDLFTLADLDTIAPSSQLPVVLSMTCYSAPFDHPTADSIGEKLLRLADRGAVAVLAASWRNSPAERWSSSLVEELLRPGATIGEAIQAAKRASGSPDFIETYNLLGDPALRLALKSNRNVIRWQTASEVDNFGYDVFRGESEAGPFERITPDPVPGAGTTDEPQRYRFVDSAFDPTKRYYYYVESISLGGVRERFTPIAEVEPKVVSPVDGAP